MLFDVRAEDLQNVISGSLFFKRTTTQTASARRTSVMCGWSAVTAGGDMDAKNKTLLDASERTRQERALGAGLFCEAVFFAKLGPLLPLASPASALCAAT